MQGIKSIYNWHFLMEQNTKVIKGLTLGILYKSFCYNDHDATNLNCIPLPHEQSFRLPQRIPLTPKTRWTHHYTHLIFSFWVYSFVLSELGLNNVLWLPVFFFSLFYHSPDMGDAKRNAKDATARAWPNDFSIKSMPNKSTRMTGNNAAKHPENKRQYCYTQSSGNTRMNRIAHIEITHMFSFTIVISLGMDCHYWTVEIM